ncbi:sec-independent translocase [Nitratireductor indicus C115]|uniref:Sec-independent protein translocase protein TatB n=1 Tax=Nitratireductor indicus C115 TaxID=1231190 RepID=K2NNN9_9HYPH|nr:Sec-independent protein translocase protein TatB [Nitratireductor indicus]EKF41005.1 sec-independent translocase [Nitratireductor indicus C115]SFQ73734.1 sec-independent protein translocase protein TatB [Nitratireductor indicus]
MFDIGWPEMLVIAVVLIVVVGPKDLPRMLRAFGRTTSKLRSMAGDFRKQFDEALKEAELDDVKTLASDFRKLDPRNEIRKHLNPLEKAGKELRDGLNEAMKPEPEADAAKGGVPAAAEPHAQAPAKTGAAAIPGETASEKPAAAKGARKKPAAKTAAASPAKAKPAASGTAAPKNAASKNAASKSAASKPALITKTTKAGTAAKAKASAGKKSSGAAS